MDFQASFAVAASKCILLLAGGDPAQHLRNTLKLSHPDWQRQLSQLELEPDSATACFVTGSILKRMWILVSRCTRVPLSESSTGHLGQTHHCLFMVTATALRVPGARSTVRQQFQRPGHGLLCSRFPQVAARRQTAQVRPVAAVREPARSHSTPGAFLRPYHRHDARGSRTAAQAATDDSADAPRSSAQAVNSSGAGLRSRLSDLVRSPFDAEIFNVAVPALGSILLDAVMLLVDTGAVCTSLRVWLDAGCWNESPTVLA